MEKNTINMDINANDKPVENMEIYLEESEEDVIFAEARFAESNNLAEIFATKEDLLAMEERIMTALAETKSTPNNRKKATNLFGNNQTSGNSGMGIGNIMNMLGGGGIGGIGGMGGMGNLAGMMGGMGGAMGGAGNIDINNLNPSQVEMIKGFQNNPQMLQMAAQMTGMDANTIKSALAGVTANGASVGANPNPQSAEPIPDFSNLANMLSQTGAGGLGSGGGLGALFGGGMNGVMNGSMKGAMHKNTMPPQGDDLSKLLKYWNKI